MRDSGIAMRLVAALLICTACVQPAYDRTVVYEVDVSAVPGVKTVGVRGENLPLSWQKDLALTAVVPDSLYRVAVTHHTGYLATEVKFVVNDQFELDNKPNRRVEFTGDTTRYQATFNVAK